MSLKHQILEYEMDFFNKKLCGDIENLNNRIHHEFKEFGKSGQVFDKDSIIKHLNNLDIDKNIEIISFEINKVMEDIIIAHYISYEKDIEIKALRNSIWKKESSNWKLYFHQGTRTEIDKLE